MWVGGRAGWYSIKLSRSIYKDVEFVEFFDVCLYVSEFLFVVLLPPLGASGVDKPHVGHLLVLPVDFVPLPLEPLPDFAYLFLSETLPG